MDLAQTFVDSIAIAKNALGTLIVSANVTKVTNTGYADLAPTQTKETVTVDGAVDLWSIEELKDGSIRADDVKFLVIGDGSGASVGDQVLLNGVKYKLQNIFPYRAGRLTAALLFQLRK